MNTFKIALAFVALAALAFANASHVSGFGGGSEEGYGAAPSLFRRGSQPERGHILNDLVKGAASALNPANWLQKVVQSVPKLEDISFGHLVSLPLKQAATLVKAILQNSYLQQWTGNLFAPNWDNVDFNLITGNGNVSVQVSSASDLQKYSQLSSGEVTIMITGLPSNTEDPSDAVAQLIEAYRERYQIGQAQEESTHPWESSTVGNLIVCDFGDQLNSFLRWITVDVEDAGKHIGQAIVDLTEFVPYYNIHLIGHSQGAHVAGSAARYFNEKTGKQLRRVTGLDPIKPFTREQDDESELSRGVADFVDVIHTTSNGVGSKTNGDVDFYPNGKSSAVIGANNIIDASLKSIEYFAETVKPGGERNFMAVECSSLAAYEKLQCHGIRIPMGYYVPLNAKGDYILKVNSNSPYGRNSNRSWRNNRNRSSVYA